MYKYQTILYYSNPFYLKKYVIQEKCYQKYETKCKLYHINSLTCMLVFPIIRCIQAYIESLSLHLVSFNLYTSRAISIGVVDTNQTSCFVHVHCVTLNDYIT